MHTQSSGHEMGLIAYGGKSKAIVPFNMNINKQTFTVSQTRQNLTNISIIAVKYKSLHFECDIFFQSPQDQLLYSASCVMHRIH